jgi:hypothetical protein
MTASSALPTLIALVQRDNGPKRRAVLHNSTEQFVGGMSRLTVERHQHEYALSPSMLLGIRDALGE